MSTNPKTKKNTSKVKSSAKTKKFVARITSSPISESMTQLETAYNDAVSGKIKFAEVKSIFKKIHKEIKKSVKSQK